MSFKMRQMGIKSGSTKIESYSDFFVGDVVSSSTAGNIIYEGSSMSAEVSKQKGFAPSIVFKVMKKKLSTLQKYKFNKRIKQLEDLATKALENGQEAMGEQFLHKIVRIAKEQELYVKGYKIYLGLETYDKLVDRCNKKLHLTSIKNYARPIPDSVLASKNKTEGLFSDYMILHADGKNAIAETDKEREEREKDPILFGYTDDVPDKLFFIDEWEDEMCNLTFDEIIEALHLKDEDVTLSGKVSQEFANK